MYATTPYGTLLVPNPVHTPQLSYRVDASVPFRASGGPFLLRRQAGTRPPAAAPFRTLAHAHTYKQQTRRSAPSAVRGGRGDRRRGGRLFRGRGEIGEDLGFWGCRIGLGLGLGLGLELALGLELGLGLALALGSGLGTESTTPKTNPRTYLGRALLSLVVLLRVLVRVRVRVRVRLRLRVMVRAKAHRVRAKAHLRVRQRREVEAVVPGERLEG